MKIAISIVLIMHGLAHLSGFLASWTNLDVGFKDENWIFSSKKYLEGVTGKFFGIIWFISMLIFVSSGVGLLTAQNWWTNTLITAAFISLLSVLPGWKSVPSGAKLGALFDVAVLIIFLSSLKAEVIQLI